MGDSETKNHSNIMKEYNIIKTHAKTRIYDTIVQTKGNYM